MGDDHLIWRLARSTRIGTSHLAAGLPCQDSHLARIVHDREGREVLVLVVSDGAGSASHSDVGSRLVCDTILGYIEHFVAESVDLAKTSRNDVEIWLDGVVDAVSGDARQRGLAPRELAGTCLACVVGPTASVFVQVGDGAIVIDDPAAQFVPVFWPQRGEYANETIFLCSPDAVEAAEWAAIPRSVERAAVLSDGLQMLALHYASRTAHAPFFEGLFATLEQHPPGESAALNRALDDVLDRSTIIDRTDDDRTLVLATRRSP